MLSYKKSLKVDDAPPTLSDKTLQQQQKLAISVDVLDSAKQLLLSKMRSEKAEREAAELKESIAQMSDRMLVMEELLLQIAQRK
jgi:hypothetical protein